MTLMEIAHGGHEADRRDKLPPELTHLGDCLNSFHEYFFIHTTRKLGLNRDINAGLFVYLGQYAFIHREALGLGGEFAGFDLFIIGGDGA